MINIIKNFDFFITRKYTLCHKEPYTGEIIGTVEATSRLNAAKIFATKMNLPLKEFLKNHQISK
jgi:hypothetical protein